MGIPISGLPSVSTSTLTDIFPAVQSGTTYGETLQEVAKLINGSNLSITTTHLPQFNGTTGQLKDSGVGLSDFYNGNIYSITDSGTANTYVGSYALTPFSSLSAAAGMIVSLVVANTNTGASTFALNGGSALNIVQNDGLTALQSGMMQTNACSYLYCLGTTWQLLNPFLSGPATFRAHSTASMSPGNNTPTLLVLATTDFDTAGSYNNTSGGNGYSYTPNIAGYYRFSASFAFTFSGNGTAYIQLYKNGSAVTTSSQLNVSGGAQNYIGFVSDIIKCNGSTDYIQVYVRFNNQSNATISTSDVVFFNGEKVA